MIASPLSESPAKPTIQLARGLNTLNAESFISNDRARPDDEIPGLDLIGLPAVTMLSAVIAYDSRLAIPATKVNRVSSYDLAESALRLPLL